MPDEQGNEVADESTVPQTPLHGYKEGRDEDVKGDTDALESNEPGDQQVGALEGEDELSLPHDKD
jgi:hypothetical protein